MEIHLVQLGNALWKSGKLCLDPNRVPGEGSDDDSPTPSWMKAEYELHMRDTDVAASNILDCPDFDGQIDYVPYVEYNNNGKRTWSNFMSGSFSWQHSVRIFDIFTSSF